MTCNIDVRLHAKIQLTIIYGKHKTNSSWNTNLVTKD